MSDIKIKLNNPLTSLGFSSEDVVPKGEFGAIMARAGIGKTSFLVQLALYAMAKENKVLHISLEEPVKKVNLWYQEIFSVIAEKNSIKTVSQAWESILPNRLIMTLKLDGFTVPGIEERLEDLSEQGIFVPDTIVIDGIPFEDTSKEVFEEIKALASRLNVNVWFSVMTHRHEQPGEDGIPVQLEAVKDLFGTAIQILPEQDSINLRVVKGDLTSSDKHLKIDTQTMLITE